MSTYFDLFWYMMSRNVSKSNFATDGAPYHQGQISEYVVFTTILQNAK